MQADHQWSGFAVRLDFLCEQFQQPRLGRLIEFRLTGPIEFADPHINEWS